MNITKRILIVAALFIGCSIRSSELTPVLREHLTRDTTGIVEGYVWDGTIKLDPERFIEFSGDTSFQHAPQLMSFNRMLDDIPDMVHGSARDVLVVPVIYPPLATYVPSHILSTMIPLSCIKGKIVGDRIIVPDHRNKQYDFKLVEDRKANLEKIAKWRHNILSPALIALGFTGCHAQMERFMVNKSYFSSQIDEVAELQQKDPNTLTRDEIATLEFWDANINWVIDGKAKKAE